MARFNVANGAIPNFPLTVILDTQGVTKCVTIQNTSATDVYISENAGQLQNTSSANLPQVGHHFPPDTPGITPFILVLPRVNGKLYARAQGAGAQVEVIEFEVCNTPG